MPFKEHGRQYDLVFLGATGYTGRLAVEHIISSFPTNLTWAVAGRSETKLQAVVDRCQTIKPDRRAPAIEILNADDSDALAELVSKTFVVITAIGPYCLHGEPAIKACAESGTHYLDVTGETPWVYHMIKKYDRAAKQSGAIIIPQAGLESVPADLCTWALAKSLREHLGAQTGDVALCVQDLRASVSGGSYATLLSTFEQYSYRDFQDTVAPFAFSPVLHPAEPKRPPRSLSQILFGSHTVPGLGVVSTSLFGGTDQAQVERSWGLLSVVPSRKHEFYGPNFHWAEYRKVRNWLEGAVVHWGLLLAMTMLYFVKPLRALVRAYAREPGTGASPEETARDQVEFRGVANPDVDEGSNKRAFCRAWYHGNVYCLTAILVTEAALTLLEDEVKLPGGFLTPCCLGQAYIERLHEAGFCMEVGIQDK